MSLGWSRDGCQAYLPGELLNIVHPMVLTVYHADQDHMMVPHVIACLKVAFCVHLLFFAKNSCDVARCWDIPMAEFACNQYVAPAPTFTSETIQM